MPPQRNRPDDHWPPDFEFCVHGRPLSTRTRVRARLVAWQQQVRAAALAAWPAGQAPYTVPIELRITHYAPRSLADMDNLIKPIQDALQGVAYLNDRVVKDVTGNWRNIDAPLRLHGVSESLMDAFRDGRPFLHIRLWVAPEVEDLG